MQITAVLTPAGQGGYVAFNPETGTTTQGDSVEKALAALKEAVELYLEDESIELTGAPLVTTVTIGENAQAAALVGARSRPRTRASGISWCQSAGVVMSNSGARGLFASCRSMMN